MIWRDQIKDFYAVATKRLETANLDHLHLARYEIAIKNLTEAGKALDVLHLAFPTMNRWRDGDVLNRLNTFLQSDLCSVKKELMKNPSRMKEEEERDGVALPAVAA